MNALPEVGQPVQYVGHEGTPMAAVVIMTQGTYNPERDPSGQFAPADATSVSVKIFRPISGRPYVRHNVPALDSDAYAMLVEAVTDHEIQAATEQAAVEHAQEFGEDDEPQLTTKPVLRYWKEIG